MVEDQTIHVTALNSAEAAGHPATAADHPTQITAEEAAQE